MADDTYQRLCEMINCQAMPEYDITLWTLTQDDYIVQGDASTGRISYGDNDYFCFICY